jgi:hypothetical protein
MVEFDPDLIAQRLSFAALCRLGSKRNAGAAI